MQLSLLSKGNKKQQIQVEKMSKFMFNGVIRIRVVEADSLKATDYSTRIFQNSVFMLSPYISLDVDDLPIGRTVTKHRNQSPFFNEDFQIDVNAGQKLNFTVFHDSALPPDEFVANCSIPLFELKIEANDFWIDLEPNGRLHLVVDLEGNFIQGLPKI